MCTNPIVINNAKYRKYEKKEEKTKSKRIKTMKDNQLKLKSPVRKYQGGIGGMLVAYRSTCRPTLGRYITQDVSVNIVTADVSYPTPHFELPKQRPLSAPQCDGNKVNSSIQEILRCLENKDPRTLEKTPFLNK